MAEIPSMTESGKLAPEIAEAKFGDIFAFMDALRVNSTSDIDNSRIESLLRIFESAAKIAGKEYNSDVSGHSEYPSTEEFLVELNQFGSLTSLAKWQGEAENRDAQSAVPPQQT